MILYKKTTKKYILLSLSLIVSEISLDHFVVSSASYCFIDNSSLRTSCIADLTKSTRNLKNKLNYIMYMQKFFSTIIQVQINKSKKDRVSGIIYVQDSNCRIEDNNFIVLKGSSLLKSTYH